MLSTPGAPGASSFPWGAPGAPPPGGSLGRLYGPRNVLYVRNLSPLVTEEHLKAIFSHCAELLRVEFKPLPGGPLGSGGAGRYCELEFSDSAGITAASQLNGTELLGLAMQVSVLNPGAPGPSSENIMKSVTPLPPALPGGGGHAGPVVLPAPVQPLAGMAAAAAAAAGIAGGPTVLSVPTLGGLGAANPAMAAAAAAAAAAALPGNAAGLLPTAVATTATPVTAVEIAMQNHLANLQAVQAAALQAKQLAARKKSELGLGVAVTAVDGRLPPAQSLVSGVLVAEPEADQLERTCFIQGFSSEYDEKEVALLLNDLGRISSIRLGVGANNFKYAIVEFHSAQDAAVVLGMDGKSIGSSTLTVKKSASLVKFRDPDGVLFDVPAPPILSQIKQQQQLLQSPEQQKEQIEMRERRIAAAKASVERRLVRAKEQKEAEREMETANQEQQQRERRRQSRSKSINRSTSRDRRSIPHRQRRDASRSSSAPSRSVSPAGGPSRPRGPLKERGASVDSEGGPGARRPLLRAPGSQAAASALKERLKRAASEGEEEPQRRSRSPQRRSPSPKRRSRSSRPRSPMQQHRRSHSSRRLSPLPAERSPPQGGRSPSPKRRSLSPRRRSLSPRGRSPSPRRRSPLQQRRSQSPRRRSMSPRGRSASPQRRRSASPQRRRSPSPQSKRSPEERRSSAAPKEKRMRPSSLSPPAHVDRVPPAAAAAAAGARGNPRSPSGSPHSRFVRDREEPRSPAAEPARRRQSRSPSPDLQRKLSRSPSSKKGRSRSPYRQGGRRIRSPLRRSRSPQRRSPQRRSPSPQRRLTTRGGTSLKASSSRSPSPTFRRNKVSPSPPPRWRRSRSPGALRGPPRISPEWGPPGASPSGRGPRGPPAYLRGPSPRRGSPRPYSGSRERSLSPFCRGRGGPQVVGGAPKRGRSPSFHLRRRSPSPRRGELRSWRRSPGSASRSPPRRFLRRVSPPGMGPFFDPRGPPPSGPPFRERDPDWVRPPLPMGGPRRYGRDIRPPRRLPPSVRDEGPPPRRPQPNMGGPPAPAVDRFKSQSRSLSEEGPLDRASSSGSPCAAAAAIAPEGEKDRDRGDARREERRQSVSSERDPPSSLPLQSRLGDLRRRLRSKRGEPPFQ